MNSKTKQIAIIGSTASGKSALAVDIAKRKGYAIAIGHPHTNTLKVLINAKSLFRDVELVYIKEL